MPTSSSRSGTSKVLKGADSYIPDVGVRLQHLADERKRFAVIARANAERGTKRAYLYGAKGPIPSLAEDEAALMVQRNYRGKLGKRAAYDPRAANGNSTSRSEKGGSGGLIGIPVKAGILIR